MSFVLFYQQYLVTLYRQCLKSYLVQLSISIYFLHVQRRKSQVLSFALQSVMQTSQKLSRSTSFSGMSKSSSNPKMKSFQGTPPVSTLNFNAKLFYFCTYKCNGPFTPAI